MTILIFQVSFSFYLIQTEDVFVFAVEIALKNKMNSPSIEIHFSFQAEVFLMQKSSRLQISWERNSSEMVSDRKVNSSPTQNRQIQSFTSFTNLAKGFEAPLGAGAGTTNRMSYCYSNHSFNY